jgi:hypothetical protein
MEGIMLAQATIRSSNNFLAIFFDSSSPEVVM